MTEIKTIDQRIREKAREDLQTELDDAFRKLSHVIDITGKTEVINTRGFRRGTENSSSPDIVEISAYTRYLLADIKKAAFEKLSPKREEHAIKAFMKKVNSFPQDVENLYNEIGN